MKQKQENLQSFLGRKLRYFLVSLAIANFISLFVVVIIQLSHSKNLIVDRVLDVISNKQNECLNFIALEDWTSLQELLEDIRSSLGIERIEVRTAGVTLMAQDPRRSGSSLWRRYLLFLTNAHPLKIDLANDFGNFKAELTLHYKSKLLEVSLIPTLYFSITVLIFTLILVAILFFGILREMKNNIAVPIGRLATSFKTGNHSEVDHQRQMISSSMSEISDLLDSLAEFKRLEALRVEGEKLKALNRLAAQVAHDIRSPLAALDLAVVHTEELPEEIRLIVRKAVNRIKSISNDLVQRFKSYEAKPKIKTVFLTPQLDDICSEKRLQYSYLPDLQIGFSKILNEQAMFVDVEPSIFKRVFSNIIDNAVEAMNGKGEVNISIKDLDDRWLVSVRDNGPGFKSDHLTSVEQYLEPQQIQIGLGLKYALESISVWRGNLRIATSERGSRIDVYLKKAARPSWAAENLEVFIPGKIIVADDDLAVHELFRQRLMASGLKMEHVFDPTKVKACANAQYFIDFDFKNNDETGIDLIKRLNIVSSSILITSHFEDEGVIKEAVALGLKILPKAMVSTIKIQKTSLELKKSFSPKVEGYS